MLSRISSCLTAALCAVAALPAASAAFGADAPIKVLSVSPSPAPVPALGHRLLPLESELSPGNSAPIYLRLMSDLSQEKLRDLREKPVAWLALPLDQFPAADARAFVDVWRSQLAQIEYGAHRQICDWNYTIPEETEHIIDISLADAQVMRVWARLVALKARVEIVEHKFGAAARTIETGLNFSRQVGDGPFLINMLVGVASAMAMLDRVDDLVGQPGAPNLYWSLTALPRPLISQRKAVAYEYKMLEWMLPEMTGLDQPRTGDEWNARLTRYHARMRKLSAAYANRKSDPRGENLAEFKKWVQPEALKYVKERDGTFNRLFDVQLILMFFGGKYRDLYDDVYKASYLPFAEAGEFYRRGHDRLHDVKNGPLGLFDSLIANIESGHRSEAMLDRKVAALRVVEALRLNASVTGGLSKSLGDVTIVPIPIDPISGKPFDYRIDGDTASLVGLMPNGPRTLDLTYRITMRK